MSVVGFIGLGNMGFPMAHLLAEAGHQLIVHDMAEHVVQKFLDENAGSRAATTNLWGQADVIITMLPNSDIIDAALIGGGVLEGASLNTLFIDMSSAQPQRSAELARILAERGMRYIDAPVSGGVRGAVAGNLAIMAGGTVEDLKTAEDLLSILGRSVIHVGAAGAGHAAKALNNLVSAASVAITSEALHIGEAFGISPETLTNVFNASSGKSNTTENKVAQFMLSGTFSSGFPIGLMTKDVNIALDLADQLDVPAKLSHHCATLWNEVSDGGNSASDHTQMYALLDRAQQLQQ